MNKLLRILVGVGLLALGVAAAMLLSATRPEAEKKSEDQRPDPVVVVAPVNYETLQFTLPSQGLIEAKRRTRLAAEVGGRVTDVSDAFDAGREVKEGDMLIKIDSSDYKTAVLSAEARLADARLALATEMAKSDQAMKDWNSLGRQGEPSELTRRIPQVNSAEAAIRSAEESVNKAKRDLERTVVKAPYDGILSTTEVELGSYLQPGAPVAEIFSASPWEIRLPLSLEDWAFLQRDGSGDVEGAVGLMAKAGGSEYEWKGSVTRTEREVERTSRSIFLVVEVPGGKNDVLLQPGLFVQARIAGKKMDGVARIPAKAFIALDEVAVVDSNNELQRRKVEVLRRNGDEVLISGGINAESEKLCLTVLSEVVNGTRVQPREQEREAVLTGEPGEATMRP